MKPLAVILPVAVILLTVAWCDFAWRDALTRPDASSPVVAAPAAR